MLFHPHDKKEESGREKRGIVHIAKIGEKREKTFNFSPFLWYNKLYQKENKSNTNT